MEGDDNPQCLAKPCHMRPLSPAGPATPTQYVASRCLQLRLRNAPFKKKLMFTLLIDIPIQILLNVLIKKKCVIVNWYFAGDNRVTPKNAHIKKKLT